MTKNVIIKANQDHGFLEFCQQIISRRFWSEELGTGSFFELPVKYFMENITDIDVIVWNINTCAIPPHEKPPEWFNGSLYEIQQNGPHPGFTKLFYYTGCEKKKMVFRSKNFSWDNKTNIPATTKEVFSRRVIDQVYQILFLFKNRSAEGNELSRDWVNAIPCPYWPLEAEEWKARSRSNGWPTDEVIEEVVSGGCLLVIKPHHSNPDDESEWRFSFSWAELTLIRSWNDAQMFIYHILRLIKRDVVKNCGGKENTHLKTYHLKTLMLWACEEKPCEFWNVSCIRDSLRELLCDMIETLIDKKCWNYFIRNYNMLDYLAEDHDFTKEVQYLVDAINDIQMFIDSSLSGPTKSLSLSNMKLRLKTSNKLFLITILYLFQACFMKPNRHENVNFTPLKPIEKTVLLQTELIDIYNALVIHRRLGCEGYQEQEVLEAKEYFKRAKEPQNSGFTVVEFSLSDNGHDLIEKIFATELESVDNETFGEIDTLGKRDKETNLENLRNSMELANSTSSDTSITYMDKLGEIVNLIQAVILEELLFQLFKRMSDHFDKPSRFLCVAYEANFHYNVLKDFRQASEMCHTAMRHHAALLNGNYSHISNSGRELLPILITNKWSPIYDEYIQILIGFLTLCRNITLRKIGSNTLEKSMMSARKRGGILIQIEPRIYLRYLSIQCIFALNTIDKALDKATADIIELRECSWTSTFFLFTALKINRIPVARTVFLCLIK